jgi:subtilase family serine protease
VAQPDLVVLNPLSSPSNVSKNSVSGTNPPYTPGQIQQAYGITPLLNSKLSNGQLNNGAGETIAIVDAYGDSHVSSDLATFDAQFGLPGTTTSQVNQFLTVHPMTSGIQSNSGWALETSLDVEWAHSVAPGANILLVQARSNSYNDLFSAVSYAASQPGVVAVSMSWGGGEGSGQTAFDSKLTHPGVTFIASSGDSGSSGGPEYPSVSPNVLAVGGTSLTLNNSGGYGSESGWGGSTGGKSSVYKTAPSYQSSLGYGVRTTPDVSFDADPNTGVYVYDRGWWQVGGTSAGAPQWAGILALVDQARGAATKTPLTTAQVQTAIYNILANPSAYSADFHDITSGSNGAFSAKTGYDLVTGIGSPIVNNLVSALASL